MTFDWQLNWADLIPAAIKIAVIIAIVLVLLFIIRRIIPKLITARIPRIREESPEQLAQRSKTLSRVIIQVISFIVWLVAILMILSAVGINILPLIAAIGVAALAVGLACQNIIRDYVHGFFIIMEDWYRVGEVATLAGIAGVVDAMTLRRTILRDINGTMHVIPNNKVDLASNMTRDWARVNLNITVAYKENLSNVFGIVNEIGRELKDDPVWGEDLLTTPEVTRVDNLGDHGVEIKIMADTKPMRQWALMGELRKRLKDRFDEEGIEIPWPHTKVYFGNELRGERVVIDEEAR